MVNRIYVEKLTNYDPATAKLKADISNVLGMNVTYLRRLLRYDVEGIDGEALEKAKISIFSEPTVDLVYEEIKELEDKQLIIVEYLDGQYDQRADSAAQCVQLLTAGVRPLVRCATVYAFEGLNEEQLQKVKKYLINNTISCIYLNCFHFWLQYR